MLRASLVIVSFLKPNCSFGIIFSFSISVISLVAITHSFLLCSIFLSLLGFGIMITMVYFHLLEKCPSVMFQSFVVDFVLTWRFTTIEFLDFSPDCF